MSAEVTLLLTSIRCTTFVSVFFSRAHTRSDGNSDLSKTNYRALDTISGKRRRRGGGGDIAGGL